MRHNLQNPCPTDRSKERDDDDGNEEDHLGNGRSLPSLARAEIELKTKATMARDNKVSQLIQFRSGISPASRNRAEREAKKSPIRPVVHE